MTEADHEEILETVADAVADVPAELPRLRRANDEPSSGEHNPSGDDQSAADRWLDEHFHEALAPLESVGAYASEERATVLDCGDGYGVAIDPLDGSDNLASNNPVGVVLGIYDAALPARGTDLVASVIVIFGPVITMTVAADGDVVQYTVTADGRSDPRTLSLSSDEIRKQTDGTDSGICGFSGRRSDLSEPVLELVDGLRADRRLRYCGAAVADVGALLEQGGVLCYPDSERRPNGVLRLQYEANPIAHVIETAGGRAIDGSERILERKPARLHERVPVYVGSEEPIDQVDATLGANN
ncbi:class 1 fructose-bisphosphatase [Natrialbaceae archaeon A-arb3/5]